MGTLPRQSWSDVFSGPTAQRVRGEVAGCQQNCWMVTTARTAMRSRLAPALPKLRPLRWVVANKLRTMVGRAVDFSAIDYDHVLLSRPELKRPSFLQTSFKRRVQHVTDPHYRQGAFFNR